MNEFNLIGAVFALVCLSTLLSLGGIVVSAACTPAYPKVAGPLLGVAILWFLTSFFFMVGLAPMTQ